MTIVLTSAVYPAANVSVSRPLDRLTELLASVYWWATLPHVTQIIVADTSNYQMDPAALRQSLGISSGVRIEWMAQDLSDTTRLMDKGWSEAWILQAALRSPFMRDIPHFYKCTGRLFVENFADFLDTDQDKFAAALIPAAVAPEMANLVDTRFFFCSRDYFLQTLAPLRNRISGRTFSSIVEAVYRPHLTRVFTQSLRIVGRSGTLGTVFDGYYTDDCIAKCRAIAIASGVGQSPQAPKRRTSMKVRKAVYGAEKSVDVTDLVNRLLQYDCTEFRVCNDLAGDPQGGVLKQLVVVMESGKTLTFPEGTMAHLRDDFFGQNGEDQWLDQHWDALALPEQGIFVDVGAGDGVLFSNTLWLERKGWSGLLIEPDPRHSDDCRRNRKSTVLDCGIGIGTEDTFYLDPLPVLSGYLTTTGTPVKIPKRKLCDVLRENDISQIDVLSIDTGGTDLEVWESLEGAWTPTVVIIASSALNTTLRDRALIKSTAERFCASGYALRAELGCNLVFVKL